MLKGGGIVHEGRHSVCHGRMAGVTGLGAQAEIGQPQVADQSVPAAGGGLGPLATVNQQYQCSQGQAKEDKGKEKGRSHQERKARQGAYCRGIFIFFIFMPIRMDSTCGEVISSKVRTAVP